MLSEESREVHEDLLAHEMRRHVLPLGFYGYRRPPSSPQQPGSEVLTTSSVEK